MFNAHYLLYCDEAMGAFCAGRDILEFAELVRLKTSALTWHAPAHWGDVVDVYVSCTKVGRTSATIHFDIRVADRVCCSVDTVYVYADVSGVPQPIPASITQVMLGHNDTH